jgi:CRP-like cAMP-binding protein
MDRRAIVQQLTCAAPLSDATLDALAANTMLRRVEPNTVITLEGEPADAMYLVAAGRVKIVRYSREGREYIVRVVEAGDLFNSVPMLDGEPCPATSIALVSTTLLVLQRAALLDLVERYPDLAKALLHEFAGRLRMFMDLVDALALHTVHGRVATLLLQQEAVAAHRAPVPMTQSEMAAHIGTVREMVARTLKAFELDGLIALQRGTIHVLDRDGLRKRAQM